MSKAKPFLTLPTLYKYVHDLKSQGKRIGLTHGAFDLFHYSHLDLLEKSAAVCDFLIVGVDSDNSVQQYKSYKRPIIREKQRARIVNAVWCVNAVYIKDITLEPSSHIDMYKNLLVDIVTVGTHFDPQFADLIEEETAKVGADLIRIETWQEPKTSSIIDSIIKKYAEDDSKEVPMEVL
jgi:cytidyltransferase-like protein